MMFQQFYLSKAEFDQCCQQTVARSKSIGDNFKMAASPYDPALHFLTKSAIKPLVRITTAQDASAKLDRLADELTCDLEEMELEEAYVEENTSDDTCCSQPQLLNFTQQSCEPEFVRFDYHIVYSDSYSVPVLYFTACCLDGSSLSLQEIWSAVPGDHAHALSDRWSFISQQEHPVLGQPYFQVHPCHTATLMSAFSRTQQDNSSSESGHNTSSVSRMHQTNSSSEGDHDDVSSCSPKFDNYVLTWLSAVGPVVGLELSMAYFQ